ncbi:hypothetical protein WKI13_03630 [Teredinibacter turnerae]|uniref:hypothetical protein n=1 Tax=Teredinibacter turnerae TaxID=2426 RepID=UPI0003720727|nr:hypothetical protein [Teredinibacter turnerae]
MKIWLLMLIILFQLGCAAKNRVVIYTPEVDLNLDRSQVHLHTYGFMRLKATRYAESIRYKGFRVKLRDNAYPGNVKDNFIIYNLPKERRHELDLIQAALSELGIEVELIFEGRHGKHEYTEGNIGVYLF